MIDTFGDRNGPRTAAVRGPFSIDRSGAAGGGQTAPGGRVAAGQRAAG